MIESLSRSLRAFLISKLINFELLQEVIITVSTEENYDCVGPNVSFLALRASSGVLGIVK